MGVSVSGKMLTPAPLFSTEKVWDVADDGSKLGADFVITLRGVISAFQGSPNSQKQWQVATNSPLADENIGSSSRLAAIERKQEAIRNLFAQDGLDFEVQPWDGSPSIKCNPIVQSIQFAEGNYFNTCPYTIVLRAPVLYVSGENTDEDDGITSFHVSKASDEWEIQPQDEIGRIYHLSRTISAVGKRFFDSTGTLTAQAWQNAQVYVLNVLGLSNSPNPLIPPRIIDDTFQAVSPGAVSGSLTAYNYLRSQRVNELAGTFSVTETWVCYDPNNVPDSLGRGIAAIEDFNCVTRTTIQDGLTYVTMSGTIKGLEQRSPNPPYALETTRYANALAKWTAVYAGLLARAEAVSTIASLNPIPLLNQASSDEINGIITYQLEWNNRAAPDIPEALSQIVTVTQEGAADVFAVLPVLGRAVGPVLQSIGTVTPKAIQVSVEAVLPSQRTDFLPAEPNTDALVLSFAPPGAFLASDISSWSARSGRFSRQTRYVYE